VAVFFDYRLDNWQAPRKKTCRLWLVLSLSVEGFSKTDQIFALPGIVPFSSAQDKIDRRQPGAGFNAFRAVIPVVIAAAL